MFVERMKPEKTMKWLQSFYSNLVSVKIDSKVPSLHVTVIIKNGKIVLMRSNRVGCSYHTQKDGPRYKLGPATIHSEVAALRDVSSRVLRNADIFVWKWKVEKEMNITSESTVKNSKPCVECEAVLRTCIKKYGIRKVYYSCND